MKCLFIYNPKSGKGKIKKKEQYIVDKLQTKYDVVDILQTKYTGHAHQVIKNCYQFYDTLVVAGGDGTLNEIINAIAEKENPPTIGYIPTGTTNDVASSLKIPKNIKKALNIILNGKVFNHDIFKCNNKYGIYVCATGVFTDASYATKQTEKKKFGKLAYYIYGLNKIFKNEPIHVKIKYDDKIIEKNCSLLLILNSRNIAGITVNKKAVLDDGFVDVVMVDCPKKKGFSLLGLLRVVKLFLFGLNYCKNKKNITYLKLKNFDVAIKSKAKINLDGEQGLKGSFNFKALDKGVSIFVK